MLRSWTRRNGPRPTNGRRGAEAPTPTGPASHTTDQSRSLLAERAQELPTEANKAPKRPAYHLRRPSFAVL